MTTITKKALPQLPVPNSRIPEKETQDEVQFMLPGSREWVPMSEALKIFGTSDLSAEVGACSAQNSRSILPRPSVKEKMLSRANLKSVLDYQKTHGGNMTEILVKLGLANEEDIAHTLTARYGYPYLPLDNYEADIEITKIIPEEKARQYNLIPVDKIGNNLMVAMANPLNKPAINEIETRSACTVQAFVSTGSEIKRAIKKYYNPEQLLA